MTQASSSLEPTLSSPASAPWHQATIAWPVESVPLITEIVHPRKLTVLEWALLRVVDEFQPTPPSLGEVAAELGFENTAFFEETLRTITRLGALVPRDGVEPSGVFDLSDLGFSALGQDWFHQGKIESQPAKHAIELWFDVMTDEGRPAPRQVGAPPASPLPGFHAALGPRSAVGLDRVRAMILQFHPRLLQGDGEVRSAMPHPEKTSSQRWEQVQVSLLLGPSGEVTLSAPALSARAQQILQTLDLEAHGLLPGASLASDPEAPGAVARTFTDWSQCTTDSLPVASVIGEAQRMIDQATSEVLVHARWWSIPELQESLLAGLKRGLRVLVVRRPKDRVFDQYGAELFGGGVELNSWTTTEQALLVDGKTGLLLDLVQLDHGGRSLSVELTGRLATPKVCELRARWLAVRSPTSGLGTLMEEIFLQNPTSLARLDQARQRIENAKIPTNAAWWLRRLEHALPASSAISRLSAVPEVIEILGRLSRENTAINASLNLWAEMVANQIPSPSTPDEVPMWLGELRWLRPWLCTIPQRTEGKIGKFKKAFQQARGHGSPLWEAMQRAWAALGRAPHELNKMLVEAAPVASTATPKAGGKNKNSRRKSL